MHCIGGPHQKTLQQLQKIDKRTPYPRNVPFLFVVFFPFWVAFCFFSSLCSSKKHGIDTRLCQLLDRPGPTSKVKVLLVNRRVQKIRKSPWLQGNDNLDSDVVVGIFI